MGKSKSRSGFQNQKPKLNLAFDSKARLDYLSGFHKRKLERKAFYKAKILKRVVDEKQRIKAQVKVSSGKLSSSHSILPEVEALLGLSDKNLETNPTVVESFVFGSKVVTVTSLDDIHMKPADVSHADTKEDGASSNESEGEEVEQPGNTSKSLLKKTANKMLQHSKAYKAAQRLKAKSKKSRKNKNRYPGKVEATTEKVETSKCRPQSTKRKGQPKLKKKKSGKR